MRFYGARRLCLPAIGATLAFILAIAAPERSVAQFFFPFFDNRPTTPPAGIRRQSAEPSLRRHGDQRRPGGAAHSSKPSHKADKKTGGKAAHAPETASVTSPPVVEGPPPPYEPQLLRLAEVMGALAYLQTVCAAEGQSVQEKPIQEKPVQDKLAQDKRVEDVPWRDRMQNLIAAEAVGPNRRDRLAGAYNQGFQGYEMSYRSCTPNALLIQRRFLEEGSRIAHEISMQYRAN